LKEQIPWFGGHSGYEQLTRRLLAPHAVWTVKVRRGQTARYLGSTYARLQGRMGRGATSLSELEFRLHRSWRRPDACHILNVENNLELLSAWPKAPNDIIGTVHVPEAVWQPERAKMLSRLNSAVALYQRDLPFFEQHVGKGRVKFIHHGADTEFFKPDSAQLQSPPRILYGGVYLRNEPMLVRVVKHLADKMKELRFDLLVPLHHRKSPALAPLVDHPAVTWHAGLNDEELRALYQRSYLMLLPMNNSGANTAVIEAISCGLPVVTCDVGGIRDYGGSTVFPVVANNDDEAMITLIEQYLSKSDWREQTSRKCRQFAEETLAWPVVAQKHLQAYQELAA
jgi:glycosyltransferase involved in cell wall biosynthesis